MVDVAEDSGDGGAEGDVIEGGRRGAVRKNVGNELGVSTEERYGGTYEG